MAAFIAVHLWQSTLVMAAAWVLTLVCRHNTAAIRYWIWFAASAKFLVPLALLQGLGDQIGRTLPEPLAVDPALIETANALLVPSVSSGVPIPDGVLPQIQLVIGGIWALGALFLCLRWVLQWQAIRSTLAFAPQMSMDLSAPVRLSSDSLTTGVFGISRPVVILPRSVARELRPRELQAVLAHEVCHIRRRDNLTAAIHKCVEVLFWFHPLVWWIGANLLREREAACDESVIEEGHEQAVYAESILQVCRLGVAAQSSHVAASTGGNLAQRMSSIMSRRRAQPIGHGRFTLLFMAAMLACYVPLAAGIVTGAISEASGAHPIAFDIVTLRPSAGGWWHSTRFDADAGQLALKNVSFRDLISSAYPLSRVNGDPQLIDRARYDIEASWHDRARTSERNAHRELLKRVLQTNTNLQVYIKEPSDAEAAGASSISARLARR